MTTFDRTAFDRTLDALGSRPRRRLLAALLEDEPRRVHDVMDDHGVDAAAEKHRLRLYHEDLPKLDELGYVEWDPDAGRVARGQAFDEVRPLVELLVEHGDELPAGWL